MSVKKLKALGLMISNMKESDTEKEGLELKKMLYNLKESYTLI